MATFYPSSTNQRDVIGNSYLRDPAGHALYPELAVSGNMVYLNYSSSDPYSEALTGSTDSQTNVIGFTDLVASHLGENDYNSWRDGRNEMLSMQANGGSMDGGDDHQMGLQTELGFLSGHNLSFQQSNISNVQGQGLSLSLGMQIPVHTFKYQPAGLDVSVLNSHQSSPGNGGTSRDDNSRRRILNACVLPYEPTGITSTIPNSKYLKPVQQLLDEVANVQKALEQKVDRTQRVNPLGTPACKDNNGGSKSDENLSNHQESTANSPSGLSQSATQDLQNKATKLLAMLDEIDRRYKQYYHQMQIVVSSFDATVGSGAAKPYTALAFQTISRHFRCLRDAVSSQIQSTQKTFGEQDGSSGKGSGISRLRYIDQHMRQQRTIQQLGVMPQHAWRPQRGLPENSVSILRAWLFEHFLHPYPNDSEKLILARQTGLTRSQVSNWFINARVRLWKPMVEDMYKEEFGENELESNSSSDNAAKGRDDSHYEAQEEPTPATKKCQKNSSCQSPNPKLISETNPAAGAPDFQNEPSGERPQDSAGICLLHDAIRHAEGSSRFMDYPMTELGRYGNGGVSLTLGLQHCDDNLQASDEQHGFLAMRGEDIYSAAPSLGFGPSQSLHDFVA